MNTLMRTVDNGQRERGTEHKEMESILADKCCEQKCEREEGDKRIIGPSLVRPLIRLPTQYPPPRVLHSALREGT